MGLATVVLGHSLGVGGLNLIRLLTTCGLAVLCAGTSSHEWLRRVAPPSAAYVARRDAFVQDVLGNLTLKGKVGQMTQINIDMIADGVTLNTAKLQQAVEYGIGSYLNSPFSGGPLNGVNGFNVTDWITFLNDIQRYVLANTPNTMGVTVPMLYGLDSVHGANYVYGATMFPHNTGLAATFNPDLAFQAGSITGKDTRTAGAPWAFSPVLGLGVQPLWSRIYETFGEDPYVASVMGSAVVRGMQGDDISQQDVVAACLKHFLGYPATRSGKDRTDAWIPDRWLRRYFVPSFQAGVDAGGATVMINSASINGIPVHASYGYLTELLRDEMGFKGLAVTDWQDIEKLVFVHHVAATQQEAVRMAIEAGVDMSMVPDDFSFADILLGLVQNGTIEESRIDLSVSRILQLKYELGLFSRPFADPANPNIATVGSAADRNVSLNAARESVTLLANNGVLPLAKTVRNVLVVGPSGNSVGALCGGWSIHWQGAADAEFAYGSSIFASLVQLSPQLSVKYVAGATFDAVTNLQDAIAAASAADVVIVAVGEAPESETPGDINDLTMSPAQTTLIQAMQATGKPCVLVLVEPRPRILGALASNASAVLMAYLPGPEGGQAIAEILLGITNPSGRLPLTYPQFTGDITVPYYHKYSDVGATFPQWSFGTGLSYTTFGYSDLVLNASSLPIGGALSVSVTVRNTGAQAGKETVLLYVSDLFASVTPEVQMLRGFSKVDLLPGDSQQVQFVLGPADFAFIGLDDKPVIEPGQFNVTVGGLQASFVIT
eukprot:TRINITY_DN10135_c0_g1_i1.p1 TRINITY_DN10135_c0_g1~~TRINITY_DN10135_c0_g1_i1.p1  ORF type:complete len:776 (+),score=271.65 TRINITY_DN10135_c0_g1_i1:102-2429(+)